jgi:predicted O-methyltransferase YrrM
MGMDKTVNIDFIVPTADENGVLERLDDSYTGASEMTGEERAFLNALILRKGPQKLLELGVSAGGSSVVMLNAIKDSPKAKLHSIDLDDVWYRDAKRKTGYIVDGYPDLKQKWELRTGGLALNFLDEFAGGIDFCFIDTAHTNPGEILDFLMILPFLEDDAVVAFHDTAIHACHFLNKRYFHGERCITNNLLMSSITGRKLIQGDRGGELFPNIAGIRLNKGTKENVFEIFNLLTVRWHYLPTERQEREIMAWFERYYDTCYTDYLKRVFSYQKAIFANDRKYKVKNAVRRVLGEGNIRRIKKLLRGAR